SPPSVKILHIHSLGRPTLHPHPETAAAQTSTTAVAEVCGHASPVPATASRTARRAPGDCSDPDRSRAGRWPCWVRLARLWRADAGGVCGVCGTVGEIETIAHSGWRGLHTASSGRGTRRG